MSSFLPKIEKKYPYEDDEITVSYSRLSRKQLISIQPFMPKKDVEQTLEEQFNMGDAMINLLAENIEKFEGLRDANGAALTFEAIKNETIFTGFLCGIAGDMMDASNGVASEKEINGDEKKSES